MRTVQKLYIYVIFQVTTYADRNDQHVVVQQRNVGKENQLKRHTRETSEDGDGTSSNNNNKDKRDVEKRSSKELDRIVSDLTGYICEKKNSNYIVCILLDHLI